MKYGIMTCIVLSRLAQKCNLPTCFLHNVDLNTFHVSLMSWVSQEKCLKGLVVISLKGAGFILWRDLSSRVCNEK